MSADWPIVKLSEIVNFKTGRLDSNQAEDEGIYPFFTCSPITLAINTHAFDDEAVLLAGNNANGVFSVKYYNGKFNAYQRTYVITPIDSTKVSVRWLYFRIKHVTTELQQLSIGSATKFLTMKILDAFEIALPSYEVQEKIADILWSLQNKLYNNRQLNQTLESMAQAIFKSWFVDFDPVKAKISAIESGEDSEGITRAAMRAISGKTDDELDQMQAVQPENYAQLKTTAGLFPSAMQETELGEVPEGWEIRQIQDIAKIIKGKSYTSAELAESKNALVTLKSFNRGGGYRLDGLKEYTGSYKAEQEVFAGDLIIAYTDVTQAADVIGKPAMVVSDSRYEHLAIFLIWQ
ncbi:MAG TPA: restriction endonuclease subunit S [Anaerovoracaceae bacterium]|nr:restriction endonuclease subunit S [Anaerovoracaceae bacterium]